MSEARRKPQEAGRSDAQEWERLNGIARDLCARAGEHFEGVVMIGVFRDSKGNQRSHTWIDGGEHAAFGAAKAYVLRAEERMRLGTFDEPEPRETA